MGGIRTLIYGEYPRSHLLATCIAGPYITYYATLHFYIFAIPLTPKKEEKKNYLLYHRLPTNYPAF